MLDINYNARSMAANTTLQDGKHVLPVTINMLSCIDKCKYLRHTINNDFTFDNDIAKQNVRTCHSISRHRNKIYSSIL